MSCARRRAARPDPSPTMAEPAVSVVIPTLNGGARFRDCLAAVRQQELDRPFEIVCIDSGSTDDTLAICRDAGARILEIERGTFNHGLTRNRGIAAARGAFVALLTQDAVPFGTDWLRWHVEALESTPRAAGSYGRQIPRDSVNPYLRWRLDQWAATRSERIVQEITDRAVFAALPPIEKLAVVAFDDVNSCIRKSVWETIPFSRVDFGEDIDWGVRVTAAGHAIVYEPRAQVVHSHNDSLWKDFNRVRADHTNLNRLLGMVQIPSMRAVVHCTVGGVRALWHGVPLEGYSPLERLYWRLYAIPWSFVQNAAQYVGARANGGVRQRS
jgi:rhamnosyltransferase